MHGDPTLTDVAVRLPDGRELRFSRPFDIGRSAECDVQVNDEHVSRKHVRVAAAGGRWTFTDLQSANGVFMNGARVPTGPVGDGITLRLGGFDGPEVSLRTERAAFATIVRPAQSVAPPGDPNDPNLLAQYEARYFGTHPSDDQPAGPRTMYIRQAYQKVQQRQQRRYGSVVAVLGVLALMAGAYAWSLRAQRTEMTKTAAEIFYLIKETDVRIARAEAAGVQIAASDYEQRKQSEAKYDELLKTLDIYGRKLSKEERLILQVTRAFGECELVVPPEYLGEVSRYIAGWRSTKRFERGVRLAQERGYVKRIVDEFTAQKLPPQFFYLALQESNFNEKAVGPHTRWGFAKGMWQFIPATARQYQLVVGPREQFPVHDEQDERHDWQKATHAAARYIKTIYSTDAQASGLLVMAGYNWGEGRVIRFMRQMPANPRDRNFWKLLEQHRARVPAETYNYVFNIVAAAVIGEDPRLFGFDFDNPLDAAMKSASQPAQSSRSAAGPPPATP